MAGSSEHNEESLGSIKFGKFLNHGSNYQKFKKDSALWSQPVMTGTHWAFFKFSIAGFHIWSSK
jgi:hypothetical protein